MIPPTFEEFVDRIKFHAHMRQVHNLDEKGMKKMPSKAPNKNWKNGRIQVKRSPIWGEWK